LDKRRKRRKSTPTNNPVAPGVDEEDLYDRPATQSEIEKGESTTVTRMIYDEYDPSRDE